jgi:site-specific recombinase XerD
MIHPYAQEMGEIRGGEAFDLLQLLNTGHSGTISTVQANSAVQGIARFTTCVLQSGVKKLGLPTRRAGLHAFRHGLGTALADAGVSPAVVQRTLRHTDIETTMRFYVHADTEAQRTALAKLQSLQMYYKQLGLSVL